MITKIHSDNKQSNYFETLHKTDKPSLPDLFYYSTFNEIHYKKYFEVLSLDELKEFRDQCDLFSYDSLREIYYCFNCNKDHSLLTLLNSIRKLLSSEISKHEKLIEVLI